MMDAGNPAVWSADHEDGDGTYQYGLHDHPIMQFLGVMDGAQENGAEQIYLPSVGWRPSTHIGVWQLQHNDVPALSPGPAAKLAFGYAFGDTNRGYICYEAAHRLGKDINPENIAAQRAFLNFSFRAVEDKAIKPVSVIPSVMTAGASYSLTSSATGGTGNYIFEWTSSCAGVFSNPFSANTTFTAPNVSETTTCMLNLVITDECGTRTGFNSVQVTINTGPAPPVAIDDNKNTSPCTVISVNPLSNDYDPENETLTLTLIGNVNTGNGIFVNNNDGTLTYTPYAGFAGTDQIAYQICDPTDLCDDAVIFINVSGNQPPLAADDSINTQVDIPVLIDVLANDIDPEDGLLDISIQDDPSNGIVSIQSGAVLYTPDIGFVGADRFEYQICDNACVPLCDLAFVNIQVGCDPIPGQNTITGLVFQDENRNGIHDSGELGQDNVTVKLYIDENSDGLIDGGDTYAASYTSGSQGEYQFIRNTVPSVQWTYPVSVSADMGTFVYEDKENENHGICEGLAIENSTNKNSRTFIQFDLNEIANSGCSIISANLVLTHGNWGGWGENSGYFDFGVHQVNTAWTEGTKCEKSESGSITWANQPSFSAAALDIQNGGADDADGTEYRFNLTDLVKDWADGTAANNGIAIVPTINTGKDYFTIYPDGHPSGPKLELVLACSTGEIAVSAINGAFVYEDKENENHGSCEGLAIENSTNHNSRSFIQFDLDQIVNPGCTIDSAKLILTHGLWNGWGENSGRFDFGVHQVNASWIEGTKCERSESGSITWANQPGFSPLALDIQNGGAEDADGTEYHFDLTNLVKDWMDGTADNFGVALVPTVNTGKDYFTLYPDGHPLGPQLKLSFTCPQGEDYIIEIDQATLPILNTEMTTDNIEVAHFDELGQIDCSNDFGFYFSNNPPVAVDDFDTTQVNIPIAIDVLLNDYDVDGDTLEIDTSSSLSILYKPDQGGTVELISNGTPSDPTDDYLAYTPPSEFIGTEVFSYRICDLAEPSLCDTALVTILIEEVVNESPVAVDDYDTLVVNSEIYTDVLENDFDNNGNDLAVSIDDGLLQPGNGNIIISGNDKIRYIPDLTYTGDDSYEYIVCDDGDPVYCDTARVFLHVINRPPNAVNDFRETRIDIALNIDILTNDIEPDGHNILLTGAGTDAADAGTLKGGNVTISNNGTPDIFTDDYIIYVPPLGFTGLDTFYYEIMDSGTPNMSDQAMVVVKVTPVIDLELEKTIIPQTIVAKGEQVTFSLTLANKGQNAATEILVRDKLPSSYSFSSDNAGGSYDSLSGLWYIPVLNSGDVVSLQIVATVTDGQNLINTTEVVAADQLDIDSTPNNDDGDQSEDDESAAAVIFECSIGDEIWLDLNANTINEDIEIGIANMPVCVVNQSVIVLNGITYLPGTYRDTVLTDTLGLYNFTNLPGGNWQIKVLNDSTDYVPTYDADGGVLNVTDFILYEGQVLPINNAWCVLSDCGYELDFGFRLGGAVSIAGSVCIDDGSQDGICRTGGEDLLEAINIQLYDGDGYFFGGVSTSNNGTYIFPYLPGDNYIVALNTLQQSLNTYHLTTNQENTPAFSIEQIKDNVLQFVLAESDVNGIDYAFTLDLSERNCTDGIDNDGDGLVDCVDPDCALINGVIAQNDSIISCPGLGFEKSVALNDQINPSATAFTVLQMPAFGEVEMETGGNFIYNSIISECNADQFTYQACNTISGCCDTAMVYIQFSDLTKPVLLNVPADIFINCDEQIPVVPLVSALDNCPEISIDLIEETTRGEENCTLYDYNLTRTWVVTDLCGNIALDSQVIHVQDVTAPDIYRIYTLPNGKKMVAGVMENVSIRWKTINLPIEFPSKPLIFTQVLSSDTTDPLIARTRNISANQFELKLQMEGNTENPELSEKVAWIALEEGALNTKNTGEAIEVLADNNWKSISLGESYSNPPGIIASIQSIYEKDVVYPRYRNLTNTGFEIHIQEEKAQDAETVHTDEKVAILAIDTTGSMIYNEKGQIIGETGILAINHDLVTVSLKNNYFNPIVVASGLSYSGNQPAIVHIQNVKEQQFDIRIKEWNYLDGIHGYENITYMVVEGSIPLDIPFFCEADTDSLILGKDIVAVDNCDLNISIEYTEKDSVSGGNLLSNRTWEARDECGNTTSYRQDLVCQGVALTAKTVLQGAIINNDGDGLMRDDLRKKGLLPDKEPYTELSGFEHFGKGGGEIVDPALFEVEGQNAVVDWVLLELRAGNSPDTIVSTQSVLLTRDGDLVNTEGDSIIVFPNVPPGDYHIAIKHRNHLAVMTLYPNRLDAASIPMFDFTFEFTPIAGRNSTTMENDKRAHWSGDLNGDGKVIFQGPNNDLFYMFMHVILDDYNEKYLPNYITKGYTNNDFNLDGRVIYQGPDNDRAIMFWETIIKHPDNKQYLSNFIIQLNLPGGH